MQIFTYPGNKMVLKCTLNNLVKKVWCEQLMNVSTRKTMSKWLKHSISNERHSHIITYNNVLIDTERVPQHPRIKAIDEVVSLLMGSAVSCPTV